MLLEVAVWLSMTSVSDMGQKTEHLELFCSVIVNRRGSIRKISSLKSDFLYYFVKTYLIF
ncbi:hypothetical protein AA106_02140 [Photorhabdus laumondii subsp. laumondii]|nr:hypothetical protein AA106_02140 [Photorhabdus laumondii subsp. laumondii]